jgi:hypothetical protein
MSDRRYGDKQQTQEKERGYYFRLSEFQGRIGRLYYVTNRDTLADEKKKCKKRR